MEQGDSGQPDLEPTHTGHQVAGAASRYEQALDRLAENPDDIDAIMNQAMAMRSMGGGGSARCRLMDAARLLEKDDHRWIGVQLQTARLCYVEGLPEEALETLDGIKHIASPSDLREIHLLRGRCLLSARRYDDVRGAIQEITRLGNLGIGAQSLIAELDIAEGEHDRARNRLQQLLRNRNLDPVQVANLSFLLAGVLDRMGAYDDAFEAARRANDSLNVDFDAAEFEAETDRIVDWSTPDRIRSLPRSTDREERSVFIVGMPRSGTTLLEQIISSHSRGDGIGERTEFEMFQSLLGHRTGLEIPESMAEADTSMLDDFARIYRSMEASIAPTAARVTNKALGLDKNLLLISRVLPESRAILLQRSPLDNLVSIYMNPINPKSNPWSCSMDGLIAGRRRFDRLIELWQEVLEMDTLPLRYEDLIDDFEARIREVLGFLEIDFDPAVIDFHTSNRVVMTPSRNQVNRPINRDAVDRWRRYERHIGPLIEAFGD